MVVNSLSFLLFFIVVFTVYYMPGIRQHVVRQNVWLLLTSYFFYGFVDWKMLPILFGITAVFYWLGAQIKKEMDANNRKKASRYMKTGVVIGIGLLLYFKYLNFFAESVASLLGHGFAARHIRPVPGAPAGSKPHADLTAMNRELLLLSGLTEAQIDVSPDCTMCADPALYYSHRRMKGVRGTQGAGIVIL